jgi:hypothetical protein
MAKNGNDGSEPQIPLTIGELSIIKTALGIVCDDLKAESSGPHTIDPGTKKARADLARACKRIRRKIDLHMNALAESVRKRISEPR